MNQLGHFLETTSTTQAEFAARLKVSQASVSKWQRGILRPSLDIAVKIERITHGAVKATSWVPEEKLGPHSEDAA